MVALNIIKLSSFYLAKMILPRRLPSSKDKEIDIVQRSLLVKPNDDDDDDDDDAQSDRINKKATLKLPNPALGIDDRATAYINKIRQKNSFAYINNVW